MTIDITAINKHRTRKSQAERNRSKIIAIHLVTGAMVGYLLLRVVVALGYWLEFDSVPINRDSFLTFLSSVFGAWNWKVALSSLILASIGALSGLITAMLSLRIQRNAAAVSILEDELNRDVMSIINQGENDQLEFKATARWNLKDEKADKRMENAILKSIAAFLNTFGGTLMIGVNDDGSINGLEADYQTLKAKDRDGFSQFLMILIRQHLGGHVTSSVRTAFHEIDGKDVCRVMVQTNPTPVYVSRKQDKRFFIRAGTTTQELDVQEAVKYVQKHWLQKA